MTGQRANMDTGNTGMVVKGMRVISTSPGGNCAEIVIYIGEGSRRRSVSRHVRSYDGQWIGRNPDDIGLAQLDAAEKLLQWLDDTHRLLEPLAAISIKDIAAVLNSLAKGDAAELFPGFEFAKLVADLPPDDRTPEVIQALFKHAMNILELRLSAARKRAKDLGKKFPREVIFTA